MKDEAQSVGKCACGFGLLRASAGLNLRLFVGFGLKLALAFAVIFVATAAFCMS